MQLNEIKTIHRNDTLNNIKTHQNFNISQIIIKHDLYNNLNIRNNNNFNIISFISKIRTIILLLIITSIIVGVITIFIKYFSPPKNKSFISYKQNLNNTDNIDGYYIPKDRLINPSYKKCSVNNCKKCYGNSDNDTCISCLNSYNPLKDENNIIINCIYSPQNEEVNNNTLKESDKINFTELNNENKIETNSIADNTKEIKTELNISNIIEIPEIKTELIQSTFIDQSPHTTSIAQITTTSKVIIECNSGYYYPGGGENECKKCSEKGCQKCHGNSTINFCDSCYSQYIPRYIENILTCFEPDENCIQFNNISFQCTKCRNEYINFENKCIEYSIEALYYTDEENLNVKLINLNTIYIDKIIFDGQILNSSNTPTYNRFPNIGYHHVYYLFKNNITSFKTLFFNCKHLVSVNFTSNIKTGNIKSLSYMFGFCTSLTSIEFSKYVEKEKNLDFIAKEKYGIKEYQDVNLNQNITIKKFQEKKNSLKKIEIYEKGIETNKNKYERQIKNNEIIINELKKEKNNLLFYYKELIGEEKFRNIIDNFKEEEKNKNINKIEEINFKDNDDIILNQDLNINNEEIITKEKEKKYPEFLDFFKEEENNSDNNNDINININNDNNKMKDEKEINIEKLGEINNLSNRNKQSEDEPPPNEYEELEEFQI